MIAMGWCCSASKEIRCAVVRVVWQHGREAILCVLTLRKLCGLSGIASRLPVASQYLRMVILDAQDDAV
jgi:hypothetical protein